MLKFLNNKEKKVYVNYFALFELFSFNIFMNYITLVFKILYSYIPK